MAPFASGATKQAVKPETVVHELPTLMVNVAAAEVSTPLLATPPESLAVMLKTNEPEAPAPTVYVRTPAEDTAGPAENVPLGKVGVTEKVTFWAVSNGDGPGEIFEAKLTETGVPAVPETVAAAPVNAVNVGASLTSLTVSLMVIGEVPVALELMVMSAVPDWSLPVVKVRSPVADTAGLTPFPEVNKDSLLTETVAVCPAGMEIIPVRVWAPASSFTVMDVTVDVMPTLSVVAVTAALAAEVPIAFLANT